METDSFLKYLNKHPNASEMIVSLITKDSTPYDDDIIDQPGLLLKRFH